MAGCKDDVIPRFPLLHVRCLRGVNDEGLQALRSGGGRGSGISIDLVWVWVWVDCVIPMRTQLLWVGSRNVVSDRAGFSISNDVVLAKLPFYFSSACCTDAVGIAHTPPRCL